jgi:hypothetical protein
MRAEHPGDALADLRRQAKEIAVRQAQ